MNDKLYRKSFDVELEPERYELDAAPRYRFDVGRRDFVKLLGGGVLVVLTWRDTAAQESGGGRQRSPNRANADELSAWIHIAQDGAVRVYTGKTEVGQNIRTSLAQAAAEELHVPLTEVHMIMADTDLTPFDVGTFGSRTTPTMAPQIRRAAAAARELLLDMAATRWNADRKDLVIDSGKIRNGKTNAALSFGELTSGQKLTRVISEDVKTTPADHWQIAGHSMLKTNGRDIVTGQHKYSTDIKRPGMVYGKIIRPPAYNTTIGTIDSAAAKAIPGVTYVRDGEFSGVTAPDEFLAAKAAAAVRVQWNSRPHLSESELFDHLRQIPDPSRDGRPDVRGNVESGMAAADLKFDETYSVAYIAHTPLEPRAAVAEWTDGRLTVWTGTQRPFGVRSELAEAFKIPESQIRVIVPDTGAAYGGKHTGDAAVEAARLAKTAGNR